MSYHLGHLNQGLNSGKLNDNFIENMDETNIIVNMDNVKTLGFRGENDVKYMDVVSGVMPMKMVVNIT